MAVKPCKECQKPVSTSAKACPHCGAEQPKQTSRIALGFAGLVLFFVLYQVFESNTGTTAATKPPPTPEQIQREKEFQQVVSAARSLKAAMKNPASFELVEALFMQGPAICITYRSTNSFNAIVTDNYVVTEKVSSSNADAWNRHCAGKTGTSYRHARGAL